MTALRIFHVDAFTDRPFAGNPAVVCFLDEPHDDEWLQAVATEMNVSDTAFVETRDGDPDGPFGLRWFTPLREIELCGHATLATAHVLWEQGETREQLTFETLSGVLTAGRSGTRIELDFPADPPSAGDPPGALVEALGVKPTWAGPTRFDYLVEVADATTVRTLAPDIAMLRAVPTRGVIVTAQGDGTEPGAGADFVSRFFGPAVGIDEDPVTGSAHCALSPFWTERLGRPRLVGYQASARGGYVGVEVKADRVVVSGQAVTVFSGQLP